MLRAFTIATLGLIICTSGAAAQTDLHIYGGGVVGGEEYTRGAFGGAGAAAGNVYLGVDAHGLWFTDEGTQILLRTSGLDSIGYSIAGMDVSFGYVARNATGRIQFIPVGIVGFTSAEIEGCVRYFGSQFCEDETLTEANVGVGVVTAFKSEGGNGLHAGFRYTRNYGAAVSFGYIWQTN